MITPPIFAISRNEVLAFDSVANLTTSLEWQHIEDAGMAFYDSQGQSLLCENAQSSRGRVWAPLWSIELRETDTDAFNGFELRAELIRFLVCTSERGEIDDSVFAAPLEELIKRFPMNL